MKVIQYGEDYLYFENSADYECLQISEEEKNSLYELQGANFQLMNEILNVNLEDILNEENSNIAWDFTNTTIKNNIKFMCDMYSVMYKNSKASFIDNGLNLNIVYTRMNKTNIENITEGQVISNCMLTTGNKNIVQHSLNSNKSAFIEIIMQNDVPFLSIPKTLESSDDIEIFKNEIIISPFLTVEQKQFIERNEINNIEQDNYIIKLSKQNLNEVSKHEEEKLEKEIINNSVIQSKNYLKLKYLMNQNLGIDNNEEIEKLKKEINEWKDKVRLLTESKFKKIEKYIDEKILEEKQNVENKIEYKKEKFKFDKNEKDFKKNIINIQEKQEFIYNKCKNFAEIQQNADEIAYRLRVKNFKYLNNPEKLEDITNQYNRNTGAWLLKKLEEYLKIDDVDKQVFENDIDDVKMKLYINFNINQKVKTVSYKISDIYAELNDKMFEEFEQMQWNTLKKAVFDKFKLIKAEITYKDLEEEHKTISQKKIFKKFADIFSGTKGIESEKIKKINEVMKDVQNKISNLENNSEPDQNKEYDLNKLVARIELYKEELLNDKYKSNKYMLEVQNIMNLNKGIKKYFDIDSNKVEIFKEQFKKVQLPMLVENQNKGSFFIRKYKRENELAQFINSKNEIMIENEYENIGEYRNNNFSNKYVINRIQSKLNNICDNMKDINSYIGEVKDIELNQEKDEVEK